MIPTSCCPRANAGNALKLVWHRHSCLYLSIFFEEISGRAGLSPPTVNFVHHIFRCVDERLRGAVNRENNVFFHLRRRLAVSNTLDQAVPFVLTVPGLCSPGRQFTRNLRLL